MLVAMLILIVVAPRAFNARCAVASQFDLYSSMSWRGGSSVNCGAGSEWNGFPIMFPSFQFLGEWRIRRVPGYLAWRRALA